MKWSSALKHIIAASITAAAFISSSAAQQSIPKSGQQITPLAPTGASFVPLNPGLSDKPGYIAGQAVTSVVSPDGRTLLVLTSGYNLVTSSTGSTIPADSTQFVFVFDISQHNPVQKQVIQVPIHIAALSSIRRAQRFTLVEALMTTFMHTRLRTEFGRNKREARLLSVMAA
jgi:hypothetical protein